MSVEISYAPRTAEKREMWSMKISPKIKYLASIGARATGQTLSAFTEAALEASFKTIKIEDDQRDLDDNVLRGKTLAQLADKLYQPTEAQRFIALIATAPWLLSDGESKLMLILQHSDYFAPSHKRVRVLHEGRIQQHWTILAECAPSHKRVRVLHEGRIQQHWTILAAIRDGEADVDILPEDQRPRADLAFGLLGDAERVALYKADPAKFKAESEAYKKAMKGER